MHTEIPRRLQNRVVFGNYHDVTIRVKLFTFKNENKTTRKMVSAALGLKKVKKGVQKPKTRNAVFDDHSQRPQGNLP